MGKSKGTTVLKLSYCVKEVVIGASLSDPHTSESFVGSSFYKYKWQKTNTKIYKFLCDTKVLYSIQTLPYMVVGLSVSCKGCDKVFLNGHIGSLDHTVNLWQSFSDSWVAIYDCWIISILEECDKVLLNGHCYYDCLIVSSMEIVWHNFCQVTREDMHG